MTQCLVYDLYLRENCKTRPEWAADLSPFRSRIREMLRERGVTGRGRNLFHIEVFDYDMKKFLQTGQFRKGPYYCLFDYENRNPLTAAASTKFFKRNDLQG